MILAWAEQTFGATFIAAGGVALLWFAIATIRGAELWAPQPIDYGWRVVMIIVSAVDVVAQQLPTFGLLQRLGTRQLGAATAFVLGWLSFGIAHILMGSFLVGLAIGLTRLYS